MTVWTTVNTTQAPSWGAITTTPDASWGAVNTNDGDCLLLQASTANLLLIQPGTYDGLLLRPVPDWQGVSV